MLVRVSRCAAARLHTQALPVSALTMKHPSVSSVVHGGGNRRSKPVAEKRCGLDDLRADPGHGRVGLMPARRAPAMRGNEEEARLFTRALASSRLHQELGLVSPRQPRTGQGGSRKGDAAYRQRNGRARSQPSQTEGFLASSQSWTSSRRKSSASGNSARWTRSDRNWCGRSRSITRSGGRRSWRSYTRSWTPGGSKSHGR